MSAADVDVNGVSADAASAQGASASAPAKRPYVPGVAPIKAEYLVGPPASSLRTSAPRRNDADDDAAEERTGPVKRHASQGPDATEASQGAEKPSDIDGNRSPRDDEQAANAEAGPSSEPPQKKLKGAARKRAKIAEAKAAKAKAREEMGGKSKQKGQNKNRKFSAPGDEFSLCNSFAEGKGCAHGEQECKFSHDLKAYLSCKPQDVFIPAPPLPATDDLPLMYGCTRTLPAAQRQEFFDRVYHTEAPFVLWPSDQGVATATPSSAACPVYEALKSRPIWDVTLSGKAEWDPKCPYGFKCRALGSHHIKAETGYGNSGIDLLWSWPPGTISLASTYGAQDERNFTPPNLQKMLRQKKYDLSRTKAVIAALAQEEKEFEKTGLDPRRPTISIPASMPVNQDEAATRPPTTLDEEDMDALMNAGSAPAPSADAAAAAAARADAAAQSQSTSDIDTARARLSEKRKLDWYHGELYLAPLTTTGNLPFRRICGTFGSDIHCGEMGLAGSYLDGSKSEWSLVRRWEGEKKFGIQLCGSKPELLVPTAEAMSKEFGSNGLDFVDVNCGCPIDMVFNHGGGSALLDHPRKLGKIVRGMNAVLDDVPVTIKLRTGITAKNTSHSRIIPRCQTEWGAAAVTMHGRSRKQRYSKRADWDYIRDCVTELKSSVRQWNEAHPDEDEMQPIPFYGNGDVYSQQEYYQNLEKTGVDGEMIARGALMKPWIFTEIKERRDWDISSRERLDMVRQFCQYGLMHWGSDTKGVQTTRRFLCEALSFWHRYVPVGLLEYLPPSMNDRPPQYRGRDDLETLLSSDNAADWVKISEMFLGKVKDGEFDFVPKHKSNSYADSAEQQG